MPDSRLVIVTVVKNDADGLEQTCASIASQDSAVAHLIVNGGVDTATGDVARKWAAVLGSQLVTEADSGPYDAMNKALNLLQPSDRVWYLNAGDVLAMSTSVSIADQRTSAPDFVWGYGAVKVIEKTGKLRHIPQQAPYSALNHAYSRTPICHQACVVRVKAMLDVGAFDSRYRIASDYRTLLLLSRLSAPVVWTEALVEYRAGGMSDRLLLRSQWEQFEIRRELFDGQLPRSLAHLAKADARITVGRGIDLLARTGLIASDWRSYRANRTG